MSQSGRHVTYFLVEALVATRLREGKRGEGLQTAVLRDIRMRERKGWNAQWRQCTHYDHEAALGETLKPDGSIGNPNAYDRYLIGVIASRLKASSPLDNPFPVPSCDTSESRQTKYERDDLDRDETVVVEYEPWRPVEGEEWIDWPLLFKFACRIIHSLYGRYVHYSDFDDLMQDAWEAVALKAIPTYDATAGARFETYAYVVMRNHLIDRTRRLHRQVSELDHELDFEEVLAGQPGLPRSPHRHAELRRLRHDN